MKGVHEISPDNPPQLPCSIFLPAEGWIWFEVCAIDAGGYLKIGYTHWSKSRNPQKPKSK